MSAKRDSRVAAYLYLEDAAKVLDESDADEKLADAVRDAMDLIWYSLSDKQRAVLRSSGEES